MSPAKIISLAVLFLIAFIGYSSVFTVDEGQLAIKFQFGEILRADYEPGLHFKVPFVNNVRKFNKRILTLDARPANYLTQEKKNVTVDFFAKWRINDVRAFYKTMSGGNERIAQERIYTIINDGLRGQFSHRKVKEVISGKRNLIMNTITQLANQQVSNFGIEIVDVRIKRIDFTKNINDSIYRRMVAERDRVAKEHRAQGAEEAEKIRAGADRQRTVLIANAYNQSEQLRGDGDAKASKIYADAFRQNPEFYAFYRSLEAYRKSFNRQNDILVIQPDSAFFEYFKDTQPARR